jgi:hypothetical protein
VTAVGLGTVPAPAVTTKCTATPGDGRWSWTQHGEGDRVWQRRTRVSRFVRHQQRRRRRSDRTWGQQCPDRRSHRSGRPRPSRTSRATMDLTAMTGFLCLVSRCWHSAPACRFRSARLMTRGQAMRRDASAGSERRREASRILAEGHEGSGTTGRRCCGIWTLALERGGQGGQV